MSSPAYNNNSILDWPYVDSPWDLLIECESLRLGLPGATYSKCVTTKALGVWSAYITPVVCSIGLFGTILVVIALLLHVRYLNRQLIYIVFMFSANAATNILFAWLWILPAKGIPYATNGKSYFFTFYTSDAVCSLHRFAYSFTTTMACNFLLLASIDRFLAIFYPLKFNHIPRLYGWYASAFTVCLSVLMMVPVAVLVTLHTVGNKLICWFVRDYLWMEYYQAMLSNSSVIQPVLVGLINLSFMLRIRQYLIINHRGTSVSKQDRTHFRSSVLMFFLSAVYLIFSMPQTIAYLVAYALSRNGGDVDTEVRLAYNIADLAWNLRFLMEVFNNVVLLYFSSQVRKYVYFLFPCLPKMLMASNDAAIVIEHELSTGASID
ncbi:uncharacterized protein DEA37_0001832 [Paragonimus westermani]|uniref:G-protein coupled receptors family 1 profile domain-containing protein n=1 Tax=Paragonimus westermani TaxID=34504 RepID=A0A5J4NAN2_9TREM|nr:uncharacterized protein DEA37_0001832 [Paragonimus westermani]